MNTISQPTRDYQPHWDDPTHQPLSSLTNGDTPRPQTEQTQLMSYSQRRAREMGVFLSGHEIETGHFPTPEWVIPNMMTQGLTVLSGQPKVGKSWLALQIVLAVTKGGHVLGSVKVNQSDVLYLPLEDPFWRLKARSHQLLENQPIPDGMRTLTWIPPMPDAETTIRDMVQDFPATRLIVVDILGGLWGHDERSSKSSYQREWEQMRKLKQIADDLKVAMLVVTHSRKDISDSDSMKQVSGTTGTTGGADTIWTLERDRGTGSARLTVDGRDPERETYELEWSRDVGGWTFANARSEAMGETRRRVYEYVSAHEGSKLGEIVSAFGGQLSKSTIAATLTRMTAQAQVERTNAGEYFIPLGSLD